MNLLSIQAGATGVGESSIQMAGSPSNGILMFLICLIFVALVAMFFFFLKRTDKLVADREITKRKQANGQTSPVKSYEEPTGEIAAAIALALSTYKIQMEELENLTLTIQKVNKQYSPWSSKIYTLRQLPR